jgi:hypothetical protein
MDEMNEFLKKNCHLTDASLNKVKENCKTLFEFFDQFDQSTNSNLYEFNKDEFALCIECLTVFKKALIDCEEYATISDTFNEEQNIKVFLDSYYKKALASDYLVDHSVVNFIYQMTYFKQNLRIGDVILIEKDLHNNQRLAVYLGK